MTDLSSSTGLDSSSTGWANDSSSTGAVPDVWSGPIPAGLVPYGAICFIGVTVFTAMLTWYYARPKLPPMVGVLTFLAWLCAFVICFLVPIDLIPGAGDTLDTVWSVLFWNSFMLMWFIIPLASGYYDNGCFTFKQKMRSSLRTNGILFLVAGLIGVIGIIYLKAAAGLSWDDVSGLAIAASNTWGLLILVVMAGYGLVEFPRTLWNMSHLQRRRDEVCYHASAVHDEAESTRDELHHTLTFLRLYQTRVDDTNDETLQMYFRDILNEVREKEVELNSLRRRAGAYDKEAMQVLEELKKPDSLVTEENLMKLNYHVKGTVKHLSLVEAQWRDGVREFVDLDAAIGTEGRSGRPPVGLSCFDSFMWYVRIRFLRRILSVSAIFSAFLTVLLIWMEFFLPFKFDASPLGAIIKSDAVRNNPLALQLFSVVPITYLSICTYFPLFNMRLSKFYYIGPHRTDEGTLLFNATFMLRAATPLAYNFVLLLKMDATALLKFIGVINVIPFFGGSFTQVFPWFIFVIALMTLLNVWSQLARLLNMERFQYVSTSGSELSSGSEAFQAQRETIQEGRKLIELHIRNEQRQKEQMALNEERLASGTATMLV